MNTTNIPQSPCFGTCSPNVSTTTTTLSQQQQWLRAVYASRLLHAGDKGNEDKQGRPGARPVVVGSALCRIVGRIPCAQMCPELANLFHGPSLQLPCMYRCRSGSLPASLRSWAFPVLISSSERMSNSTSAAGKISILQPGSYMPSYTRNPPFCAATTLNLV